MPDVPPDDPADADDPGCPKCGHDDPTTDRIAATGAGLPALVELQNKPFTVVRCDQCGYCELYSGPTERVCIDLFLGREYVPPGETDVAEKRGDGPVYHCSMCGATADEHATVCPGCDRSFR
jgi:predicted nucleic-acid-binding Zn-ribbon protein